MAPGTIDTDMVRNNPPEAQARMAAASPMNRAAHADEMIGPVMFLVSDAGSFMTGQVVLADGGMVPALSGAGWRRRTMLDRVVRSRGGRTIHG